jgi:hypothetical protein
LQSRTIKGDFACVGCNYNLRGLTSGGRCPECAMSIAQSITIQETRWSEIPDPLWRADSRWVRKLMQGACAAMAAISLRAVVVLLPGHPQFWSHGAHRMVLASLIIAWALDAFACWRFATPEPGLSPPRPSRVNVVTRIVVTIYYGGFFLPNHLPLASAALFASTVIFSGAAGSLLVFMLMSQIAGRIWPFLWGQSVALAALAPLWFLAALLSADPSSDSVQVVLCAPTLFAVHAQTLQHWRDALPPFWWMFSELLLPIWAFLFLCQLLAALIYARNKRFTLAMPVERTPASSRP